MNDDLNLLITFLSIYKTTMKVAIKIEHGMNSWIRENYKYYGEDDVLVFLKEKMPPHVKNDCDIILDIEEIFYIEG